VVRSIWEQRFRVADRIAVVHFLCQRERRMVVIIIIVVIVLEAALFRIARRREQLLVCELRTFESGIARSAVVE